MTMFDLTSNQASPQDKKTRREERREKREERREKREERREKREKKKFNVARSVKEEDTLKRRAP